MNEKETTFEVFYRWSKWVLLVVLAASILMSSRARAETVEELRENGIPASSSAAAVAKGTVWVATPTNWIGLAVGQNGYVLTADSAEASGLKWAEGGAGGGGTVTNITTGTGLQGGPITNTGTIDLRLDVGGSLSKTLGAGSNELGIAAGGIVNSHVSNTAAIGWTKLSKTGSSLADISTRSASDLSSGTLPDARFPATLPALSGVNLTALNASNLGSGTVPDARFPATLPALSGVNLTALNASNLGSGTVPDARFPATLPAISGANLTSLNASSIASGSLPLARITLGTALQQLRTNAGVTAAEWFTPTTPAPVDATYITQTANGTLTNEFAMGSLATGIVKNTTTTGTPSIAVAGTDYEVPTTAGAGLTRTVNAYSVNTTQNIAKLSNLTTNGFVKTSSGDGTLSVDTSTYLTSAVTSVALALPTSIFDVSGSPVTTTGTLTATLDNQSANTVFAGPTNGAAAAPAFRSLVAADVPTLNQNTTGSAATLTTPRAIYGNNFDGSAALTQIIASTYGGTGNAFFGVTGPTTTTRTFTFPDSNATILYSGGPLGTPSGGTLTNATGLPLTTGVTGTLPIANGGTGQTSQTNAFDALAPTTTQGDIMYHNGTDNVRLAKSSASSRYLSNQGGSNNPSWEQIDLPTGVKGELPVANGGTGLASITTAGVMYGNGTSAVVATAAPADNGKILGSASGVPAFRNFSGSSAKTGAYTVVAADSNKVIKCDASGGAFTITLTAAATLGDGFVVTILKTSADTATSTNAVTIDANSTETINGALTNRLQAQYSHVTLLCDGSNWFVSSAHDYIQIRNGSNTAFPSSGIVGGDHSLEIPAGDWSMSANVFMTANGATVTDAFFFIGNTSGNNFSNLENDNNYGQPAAGPTTAPRDNASGLPDYREVFTAATTRYLKISGNFSVATPNYRYRFNARRYR